MFYKFRECSTNVEYLVTNPNFIKKFFVKAGIAGFMQRREGSKGAKVALAQIKNRMQIKCHPVSNHINP